MRKSIIAAVLLTGALVGGPVAQAGDIDVGISIGIPGMIWGGPAYYPPPPPPLLPSAPRGRGPGTGIRPRTRLSSRLGGPWTL